MDGFLLINKDSDWTSRDVCNKVQSIFDLPKVGHIGTLDPFATGLLVVTIGKGTKAGQFLESGDKTYLATLKLGEARDGGDVTGEVMEHKDIPALTKEKILEVFNSFTGEIEQVPPLKSAVHFKGRKLYTYAYNNEKVTPPSRKVKVNSLELIEFNDNTIVFRTNVSSGTYIRVLGEDIAKALGTVGYLEALHREKVADLDVKDAHKLTEVKKEDLISISDGLKNMVHVTVDEVTKKKVKDGLTIIFKNYVKYDNLLLVDEKNVALAVYTRVDRGLYKSLRGLF